MEKPEIVTIPALIDMHVHFREPGLEYKETIKTGARAAIAGGFKTVCVMANNIPPTDTPRAIEFILMRAANTGVDVQILPIAAVTDNLDSKILVDFAELKQAGAIAFSNDGLPILDKNVFEKALLSGELIISHAEDEVKEVEWQIDVLRSVSRTKYARLHFAHISKARSVELIRAAKDEGLELTCETAPHYFTFTNESITQSGVLKMNPPLGTDADREAIIEGLCDGTIDVIATDHAPHSDEEKMLPYEQSPPGITGLETALGLTLTKFDLEMAVLKMATNPARILGIENKKTIQVDLNKTWRVMGDEFESKCKITPYKGMMLKGKALWRR